MTASLSGVFSLQEFTDAGLSGVGYRLYTYIAGTTTFKTAYTDAAGAVPHTYTADGLGGQYIALNARGELPAPLFLTTGAYDIALKRPDGSTVWTRQAVPGSDASDAVSASIAATFAANAAALADRTDATKNAGLIGFNPILNYATGTIGWTEQQWGVNAIVRGAVADDITDNTTIFNTLAAAGGRIFIPPGTYKIAGTLNWDLSLIDVAASGVIFDMGGTGTMNVYSSVTFGNRPVTNWIRNKIRGICFKGNGTAATVGVTVGKTGATYANSSEITFEDCSWTNFPTMVAFTDNAWRTRFVRCGWDTVTTGGRFLSYPNGLSNAGEVMNFDHCWFAGGTGDVYLDGGLWNFISCSFGIQATLRGVTGAIINLFGTNIEAQPSTGYRMIRLAGNSSLNWNGGTFIINTGAIFVTAPIVMESTDAAISFNNVNLMLASTIARWEADTYKLRHLVCGPGRVSAFGCTTYAAASLTGTPNNIGFSKSANLLSNGDAEYGNLNNWTSASFGTGGSTLAATVASKLNGTYGFEFNTVAGGGFTLNQTVPIACAGRLVNFSYVAQLVSGSGTIDFPSVNFIDKAGAAISGASLSDSISGSLGTWQYRTMIGFAPPGTQAIQVSFAPQGLARMFLDELTLCVM